MNANDILDVIGDAKGTYVWGVQEVRSGTVSTPGKMPAGKRTLLIAATIALMLLLVGCAIAYAQGWFVYFFSDRNKKPLTDSQIELIEDHEQQINQGQTTNGWTVELRSVWKDNTKAYVMIGITAPEGVDLEPAVVDNVVTERFSPGNDSLASDLDNPPAIVVYPEGVMPSSMSMSWEEDGDGLDNTKNYVLEIKPDLSASSVDPFGPEAVWTVRIEDIVRTYDDEAYKQELLSTKYQGEYGVMFTPEETQRIKQKEILVEGSWEFTFTFSGQIEAAQEIELLTAPIQTVVEFPWQYGQSMWDVVNVRKTITVTSVVLQPLTVTVSYEPFGGWPNFYFDDGDIDQTDIIHAFCVLKDGSQIALRDWGNGGTGYKLLEAASPIVPEEVRYVQMPDGTKIHTDGTVEYAAKKAPPSAVLIDRDIASTTGIYAYCADFDADAAEDLAIWYDGAFHILCLLTESGEIKAEFVFENGADIYETYNQRAEAILHEPNLIRISETANGIETVRYFRVEEDGLHLSVGIRYDPAGGEKKWFQSVADSSVPFDASAETWEPITEEGYQRIAQDYQVMQYRLFPVSEGNAG